jgi:hypothetical protein
MCRFLVDLVFVTLYAPSSLIVARPICIGVFFISVFSHIVMCSIKLNSRSNTAVEFVYLKAACFSLDNNDNQAKKYNN